MGGSISGAKAEIEPHFSLLYPFSYFHFKNFKLNICIFLPKTSLKICILCILIIVYKYAII